MVLFPTKCNKTSAFLQWHMLAIINVPVLDFFHDAFWSSASLCDSLQPSASAFERLHHMTPQGLFCFSVLWQLCSLTILTADCPHSSVSFGSQPFLDTIASHTSVWIYLSIFKYHQNETKQKKRRMIYSYIISFKGKNFQMHIQTT